MPDQSEFEHTGRYALKRGGVEYAPEFSGLEIAGLGSGIGALLATVGLVPFVILATSGLLDYLRSLSRSAIGWLIPLNAATQVLSLCVIASILFLRFLVAGNKIAYLDLERALVVERLSPLEIRTRYVSELLGAEVGEWLKGISTGITEANEKLKRATSGSDTRLTEIDAIDGKYLLERRGRAGALVDELEKAAIEHTDAMGKYLFQVEQYGGFVLSAEERAVLKGIVAQLRESLGHAAQYRQTIKEILGELRRIMANEQ